MPEPDPFASPYHPVNLPGQSNAPLPPGYEGYGPGYVPYGGWPAPMLPVDVDPGSPRPAAMTTSFWGWLAGVLMVVFALPGLYFTSLDALADDLMRDAVAEGVPIPRAQAEFSARLTPIFFMMIFAALSVPFVIGAIKLRSGREWARVLLTVLGTLGVMFGLIMLIVFTGERQHVVSVGLGAAWVVVFTVVCVVASVTMYLPASNAYMRSVSR